MSIKKKKQHSESDELDVTDWVNSEMDFQKGRGATRRLARGLVAGKRALGFRNGAGSVRAPALVSLGRIDEEGMRGLSLAGYDSEDSGGDSSDGW